MTPSNPTPTGRRASAVLFAAVISAALCGSAAAEPAELRANLAKLLPQAPKVDEVTPSPIPGLWLVRAGGHIVYSNAEGTILVEGHMVDLKTRANLTQAALAKALAVDFDALPLKDAFVAHRQGKGERRLAVFADPNCGYCKRFEPDLAKLENVTVYVFPLAILGPGSETASRNIVCAQDPGKAWRDWMLSGTAAPAAAASCDSSAVARNMAFATANGITGTPTTFFTNRDRAAGAMPLDQLRARLDAAGAAAVAKK